MHQCTCDNCGRPIEGMKEENVINRNYESSRVEAHQNTTFNKKKKATLSSVGCADVQPSNVIFALRVRVLNASIIHLISGPGKSGGAGAKKIKFKEKKRKDRK